MNRFPRRHLRSPSINLALLLAVVAAGCGEAKTSTLEPLETEVVNGIAGTLHARIATFEDGHAETYYRLVKADGDEIHLDFGDKGPTARVGARIAVRGPQIGDRLQVDAFDVLPDRANEQVQPLRSHGPKTLKIAMLNVSSKAKATLETRTQTAADSPTAYYRDNSYGDWNLQIDVLGPYSYTVSDCSDTNIPNVATDIRAKATAAGVDLSVYDNYMYYLTSTPSCQWSGLAEVGINSARGFKNGIDSWYNFADDCVVLAQELAHNFGLLHSHLCSGAPYSSAQWDSSACPMYKEYGDPYTPMGGGCGHFNAPEMGEMGYLSPCNTLAVTSSGTFEIGPIETRCAGPQVLQIPGAANVNQGQQYIYVEYRAGKGTVGSDNKSPAGIYFHASAELGGLLAPTPPDSTLPYVVDPFYIHAPLTTANASWTESTSGATITLKSLGATASVQIAMTGGGDGGAPKCVDGTTPPSTPMCGVDGGTGGTGGSGGTDGGIGDASIDGKGGAAGSTGTGGAAGAAGTGGAAGSGGKAGTGGAAGTTATGGAAGTGTGGTAGKGGTAGTGGAGGSTGGAAGTGTGGTAGATGGTAGTGTGGTAGSTGTGGSSTGGTGGTGGSTTGTTPPPAADGCSCSIPGGQRLSRLPTALLGLAALLPAWRRRRKTLAKR
jgi:MYXO-CTERM domain-containing protein